MVHDDYYRVLGVNRDADLGAIKQAYRKEAMKSHPDASGGQGTAPRFREVEEAYETLRDRDRRQAYDRELARRERPAWHGEAPRPGRPGVYPLDGGPLGPASRPPGWRGAEPLGWGALLQALAGFPFAGASAREDAPLLEVLLSPEEASSGVAIAVDLPALSCPECGGAGAWGWSFCPECGGSGRVEAGGPVTVELPAGVRHGSEFLCRLRVRGQGGPGFHIRVLVDAS